MDVYEEGRDYIEHLLVLDSTLPSPDNYLEHYGILGMKWGVRRTPEELGHKKVAKAKNALQKYKDKKVKKINKMYSKPIRKTEEALEYDPENKKLKKQLKGLKTLMKKDIAKVDNMTYTDVVNEKKAIKKARQEKAWRIADTTVRTAGAVSLWAAKMTLTGVRIYGTFKAAELVGELGMRAYEWLQSPEGQQLVDKGMSTVNTIVTVGDMAAKVANPEAAKYLDSQYLFDTALQYGKDYVKTLKR